MRFAEELSADARTHLAEVHAGMAASGASNTTRLLKLSALARIGGEDLIARLYLEAAAQMAEIAEAHANKSGAYAPRSELHQNALALATCARVQVEKADAGEDQPS